MNRRWLNDRRRSRRRRDGRGGGNWRRWFGRRNRRCGVGRRRPARSSSGVVIFTAEASLPRSGSQSASGSPRAPNADLRTSRCRLRGFPPAWSLNLPGSRWCRAMKTPRQAVEVILDGTRRCRTGRRGSRGCWCRRRFPGGPRRTRRRVAERRARIGSRPGDPESCGSKGLTSTPSHPAARARASSIGSNAPVSAEQECAAARASA